MPLLLHSVERAEPQPDHTSLFVDRFVDPPNDDGVGLRGLQQGRASAGVLSWWLRHLEVLALAEVHDLGVDVELSPGRLRLGHHIIVWLFSIGRYLSAFSLTGIDHCNE